MLVCVQLIPATARSKANVCGRSLAGIAGSNPAEGMDFCFLWILRVARYRTLRQGDPSSRGVVWIVCVCVSECEQVQK